MARSAKTSHLPHAGSRPLGSRLLPSEPIPEMARSVQLGAARMHERLPARLLPSSSTLAHPTWSTKTPAKSLQIWDLREFSPNSAVFGDTFGSLARPYKRIDLDREPEGSVAGALPDGRYARVSSQPTSASRQPASAPSCPFRDKPISDHPRKSRTRRSTHHASNMDGRT